MTRLVERYAEVAFVFAVTGAAMTGWLPLPLIVGAAFYVALAVVADRRTPPSEGGQ